MKLIKLTILFLVTLVALACSSAKTGRPAGAGSDRPQAAASPSPTKPPVGVNDGTSVTKPIDMSFSTYSEKWPDGWQFIDPDENADKTQFDVKTGVLRLVVPSGKDLFGENITAPRYVKAIKGDFQIETRVRATPTENYQGAGLLIFNDKLNYVRLERAYGGTGGGGSGIRLDVRKNDEYTSVATPEDIPFDGGQVDLRLVKKGGKIIAFWRTDENSEWRQAGEAVLPNAENVLAGLIVCNTASPFEAKFVSMALSPAPGVQ